MSFTVNTRSVRPDAIAGVGLGAVRRLGKRLVRAAVVVVQEEQAHRVGVILRLLAERIRQASKAAALHPERQV
jgi:hypothetical protein